MNGHRRGMTLAGTVVTMIIVVASITSVAYLGLTASATVSSTSTSDSVTSNSSSSSSTSTTTTSQTDTTTFHSNPQRMLFRVVPDNNSTTELFPANTLVWTTFTWENQTTRLGAAEVVAYEDMTSNLGSNFTVAAYIDGTLSGHDTYEITSAPAPSGQSTVSGPTISALTVIIQANIAPGTTVALAFYCQSAIQVYSNHDATYRSYEVAIASLPLTLPSTNGATSLSYNPSMWGYD